MIWLRLLAPFIPYIAGAALIGGVVWYIYSSGQEDERNKNAGQVIERTEEQRRDRETDEERNRRLDDAAATERLRPRPRD